MAGEGTSGSPEPDTDPADERLAETGDVEAMYRLACAVAETDPKRALYWVTRAAESGHQPLMYNLGVRYMDRRPDEAERWWRRAAESGHPGAMSALAWLYRESDPAAARRWEERAASLGYERSILMLGGAARRAGDYRAAARWYEAGVAGGSARAMYWLSTLIDPYQLALVLPTNKHRRASRLLERASELGDPYAQYLLGWKLTQWDPAGAWVRSDRLERARALYERAAEQGLHAAMLKLAHIARGHDGDDEAAQRWLELASDHGSVMANYMLAVFEPTTDGIRARLRRAAELGGRCARILSRVVGWACTGVDLYRRALRPARRRQGAGPPTVGHERPEAVGRDEPDERRARRVVMGMPFVAARLIGIAATMVRRAAQPWRAT